VLLVVFVFCWPFSAHSSMLCISAHQTASSMHKPSNSMLLHWLALRFQTPWIPPVRANPKSTSIVNALMPDDHIRFSVLLAPFQHSGAQNSSFLCLWAPSHDSITSADGHWVTRRHAVTLMVGTVHCVATWIVGFITLATS